MDTKTKKLFEMAREGTLKMRSPKPKQCQSKSHLMKHQCDLPIGHKGLHEHKEVINWKE